MKNKYFIISIIFIINLILISELKAEEDFNFNVTELEILENGNKIIGKNRGEISSNDGVTISADNFTYNRMQNVLIANGNVIIVDDENEYRIFSNDITYDKNKETIFTKGSSKAKIRSRYSIETNDLFFYRNEKILNSNKKSTFRDEDTKTLFNLEKFDFAINDEILKGEKILVITDYNLPQSDKLFFNSSMFDLKNKSFIAKDIEIKFKKNIFDNLDNDPRLKGVSVRNKENITTINKGIFTSCKKEGDCPPWVISAKKITHDKNKKLLIYNDALLKIYNVPVLYFPKFFHPDPTVKRQSGLLKPQFNNSNILGSSFNIPYYHVLADNKDFTFIPTIFDNDIKMFQNEYRQKNQNSSLEIDFGFVDDYKSALSSKKKKYFSFICKF